MYANFPSRSIADPAASADPADPPVAADFAPEPLDAAAAQHTLDAIHGNTRLARSLLDHLRSDDPGSRGLPVHQRESLQALCADIMENRSYALEGSASRTPPSAAMPPGVPLPITERHQLIAQQDRQALDAVSRELAAESRRQLKQSLDPLRQDLAALEAACQSLFPPLQLPFCPKLGQMLDHLSQVREDDVTSLSVRPTVGIAANACAGLKNHLAAVHTLASLQKDLGLRKASPAPGTSANLVTWHKACDALRTERWEDFRTLTNALSRLTQPAPVLARPAGPSQS